MADASPLLPETRPAAPSASVARANVVMDERSWWEVWRAQYVALVRKSFSMLRFRFLSTLLVVVLPSVFIGALYGLYSSLGTVDASPQSLTVQKCSSFDVYNQPSTAPCVTLVYAPSTPLTDAIMARVAANTGLSVGSDIQSFADSTAMATSVFDRVMLQQVDTAVQFVNATVATQITYSLWVNASRLQIYAQNGNDALWRSTGVSARLLGVQKEVDAAIIAQATAAAVLERSGARNAVSGATRLRADTASNGIGARLAAAASADASVQVGELSDATSLLRGARVGAGSPTLDVTVAPFSDWEVFGFAQNGPALGLLYLAAATFIVTGVVLAAVLIMTIVTGEKSRKLVGSLRTIGLYESAYWLSWMTAYVPVLLAMAMLAALVGMSTGILLFTNTDYGIHMMGIFLLGTSTLSMALCCASCVRAQRWVNIVSFCKFACAVAFTTMFASLGLYWIIYAPMLPTIIPLLVCWMPFFHYGKLISSIIVYLYMSSPAGGGGGGGPSSVGVPASVDPLTHMSMMASHVLNATLSTRSFVSSENYAPFMRDALFGYDVYIPRHPSVSASADSGVLSAGLGPSAAARTFGWNELAAQPAAVTVVVDGFTRSWSDVAPSFNLWMMLVLTIGYLLLAWYFGQVFTGDLGAAQPFYFPLSPYYWGLMKLPAQLEEGDTLALVQRLSAEEQSVRVHKVSKSYKKNTALKEVSLVLPPGQCTALLGQNGAGKSTLCHVLAGLITPTHGEAYMFGKSVRSELSKLRDWVGICPQDDLLWEELTARQHVELFARFKGVPEPLIREHAEARLRLVQLIAEADSFVNTFSGGMKRRLSVAMAAVGNPRIIFLDEVSTGLDPISKRRVHSMVERLKPGRVLVLTTHNMQEADALGDTVAILADGRLRAYGTPLYLKNRYGAGYQVNIITEPVHSAAVKAAVLEELPGAEFVGDVAAPGGASFGGAGGVAAMPGIASVPMIPGALTPQSALLASVLMGGGAVAGAGDILRARVASGAVTVAVPRHRLAEIPRLLRRLQLLSHKLDADVAGAAPPAAPTSGAEPTIREWGISGSTLEEVFLKLAATNNSVNATNDAASDGTATAPVSALMAGVARGVSGGATPAAPLRKMCSLCHSALTDNVVLYNSQRVVVAVDGVICSGCATRTEEEIREARAGTSKRASAPAKSDGTALAAAAVAEEPSQVHMPAAARAMSLNAPASVAAGTGLAPVAVTASADSVASASASGSSSRGGRNGASMPVFVPSAGYEDPLAALPAAQDASSAATSGGSRKVGRGGGGYVEPVSWFTQFYAVLLLRCQLQWKQRWTNVCNICFVLIGVVLTLTVTPQAAPLAGVRCLNNGGFYVDDITFCVSGVYAAQVVNAVDLTPIPDHSYGNAAQLPRVRDPYQEGSFAHLLYAQTCTSWQNSSGYGLCTARAVLPDWQQAAVAYVPTALPNVQYGAGVWYVDGPDASDVKLTNWDVLGVARGTTGVPAFATFVDAAASRSAQSAADIDNVVLSSQRTNYQASTAMKGACADVGEQSFGQSIGYEAPNVTAAAQYFTASFPSVGIGIRRARPFDANNPTLAYDLRVWAASNDYKYQPQRGNTYSWTSVYVDVSGSCQMLAPQQPSDDPWTSINMQTPAAVALSGMNNALLKTAVGNTLGTNTSTAHIRTSYVQWPRVQFQAAVQGSTSAFQALLWPLFTLFLLPLFVYPVSFEKDHKLYAMMSMSGMRQSAYMAAHYTFSFFVFVFVASLYCVAGYLGGVPAFRNTGAPLFVALLFTWGHAQTGFAIFIASVFRNPRTATIVSYMLGIIVSVASFLIYQFTDPWPTSVTWVPFMGYTRASTLTLSYGGSYVRNGSELQSALLITAFEGTLALLLGIYFHAVLSGPESIAPLRHPLYPLEEAVLLYRRLRALCRRETDKLDDDYEYHSLAAAGAVEAAHAGLGTESGKAPAAAAEPEDPDVVAERQRVRHGDLSNAAVVLDGLRKDYGAGIVGGGSEREALRNRFASFLQVLSLGTVTPARYKRAVDDLCLAINYGECLGLLGPNGAGKTTTISMLTGVSEITRGAALLAGHNVATQLNSVWRLLGVTPQFDTQWDELSVAEHLYFFARMKGVRSSRLRGVVQSVAERVNLDGDAFSQLSRGLSGGMRRRLSIAISLLGDPAPALVLLDEPSTGLDPASRRDVWRILQSERNAGRAMIITTHAMEEADALCDRIAIMYGGRLQCVGSQLRLKSKFGNGYKVTLTLQDASPDGFAAAHRFVTESVSSRARLVTRVGPTVSYLLPPDGVDVADLFQVLEANKGRANIQEYGIAATTLEEVFVRVCEGAEARAGAAPAAATQAEAAAAMMQAVQPLP